MLYFSKGEDHSMMYTELFCFEGASATDAAPRFKAARKQRARDHAGLPQIKAERRADVIAIKGVMAAVLGRRAIRLG